MTTALLLISLSFAGVLAAQEQELVPLTTCVPATRSELRLDRLRDGVLYVPKGYKAEVALPLLVWLHGAGGSGNVSPALSALADEFSFLVLAPDSREWTWGSILGDWDPDLDFLQIAMRQAQTRCAVDRDRIWLGGFSDGASFSLSLGISYGNIFRRVYAGSPGLMQPIAANGKPPIFISHGTQDTTMPIEQTSRRFVPRLKTLGYDVTYREYEGRHTLPPEILRAVVEWLAASGK
jgi:phospholipase/carboxylesterase